MDKKVFSVKFFPRGEKVSARRRNTSEPPTLHRFCGIVISSGPWKEELRAPEEEKRSNLKVTSIYDPKAASSELYLVTMALYTVVRRKTFFPRYCAAEEKMYKSQWGHIKSPVDGPAHPRCFWRLMLIQFSHEEGE